MPTVTKTPDCTNVIGENQGWLPLPVVAKMEGDTMTISSFWEFTETEIKQLNGGHLLEINCVGGQPPIKVTVVNPSPQPWVRWGAESAVKHGAWVGGASVGHVMQTADLQSWVWVLQIAVDHGREDTQADAKAALERAFVKWRK